MDVLMIYYIMGYEWDIDILTCPLINNGNIIGTCRKHMGHLL